MLRKLKASMGEGGAIVETDLIDPTAAPGGVIQGVVRVSGGQVKQSIKYVAIGLEAIVEVEGDDEWEARQSFAGDALTGAFEVGPGFKQEWKFDMRIPWETPFNVLDGRKLQGVRLGIETELEVERSVDKGDLDSIQITALPAHVEVHKAVERLGFRLKDSDLEKGHIPGAMYPFYQELEYAPGPQYSKQFEELEIAFIANAHWMQVLIEADRRGSWFAKGGDAHVGFRMPTDGRGFDIDAALKEQIDRVMRS